MSVTIAVVIPVFNRRRLFREALTSVVNARPDEIFIVDDGTDVYDVGAMVERDYILPSGNLGYEIRWGIVAAPPMTIDERMTKPRQGSLINKALEMVTSHATTLLCDDDLMAPGWLDCLRNAWALEPERELVRGDWLVFNDGETPREDNDHCPLDGRGMTAGNFAWHSSLHRDRGARWPEDMYNCLDDQFLRRLVDAGVSQWTVPNVGFAGWRREHAYVNGNWSNGSSHREGFRAVLERGYLE